MPSFDAFSGIVLVALLCSFFSPSRHGLGRRLAVAAGAVLTGITAGVLLDGSPVGVLIAAALGAGFAALGPSPRSRKPRFGFGRSFASSSLRPGVRKVAGRW